MSTTPEGDMESQAPHTYFVDEAGDGVIYDGKGRVLVGTGKVQDYFTLGMVECWSMDSLTKELAALRAQLLADPYFKGVPSMQPEANKTALFFHAKDDLLDAGKIKSRKVED
jgi:hypothetical protein